MVNRSREIALSLFRVLRPHQWSKNLFVIAPLVFSRELGNLSIGIKAILAAFLFCLASGAVYTMNDIVDAPKDRLHPLKCRRPIASGALPVRIAVAFSVLLACGSLLGATIFGARFILTLTAYFVLNIAYSLWLRKVIIADVICIAFGFLLRVIAGSYAARVDASVWIMVCTFFVALFLALGKRRHELLHIGNDSSRPVLRLYTPNMIRILMNFLAGMCAASYIAYTMAPHTRQFFGTDYLVVSVPFVFFGLFRYMKISANRERGESPTDAMVKDPAFVLNLLLWGLSVIAVIYFL